MMQAMKKFASYSLAWLLTLAFTACNSNSGNSKGNESPSAQPAKSPASDVGFLVENCVGEGYPREQCDCLGGEAEKLLEPAMIDKMRNTPDDGDPEAKRKHYTPSERERLVGFLSKATVTCKLREGAQQ